MPQQPATSPTPRSTASTERYDAALPPLANRLSGWLDREWLLFEAVLLVPAMLCLLYGDTQRAGFYARLALHTGALKWLGWTVLSRWSVGSQQFLRFPIEIIAGLGVAMAWFYVRNTAGWLLPGTYSLTELKLLPWLVAATHAVDALAHRRELLPSVGRRLAWLMPRALVYVPFVLTLSGTLWSVANALSPPSQDGWFHAFIARVYLNDGLFYAHFNGGHPIFYVSGFGAINAVTAAMSGLDVVPTHNLQHIFMGVVGLFMLTTLVELVAQRSLGAIHTAPLVLLSSYPVHNLPPDMYWTHGPQQSAPAFLLALPVLSLLLTTSRRTPFYVGLSVQAVLAVFILALSPACAVFLLLAGCVALIINVVRGRVIGGGVLAVAGVQAGMTVLVALLILGADRYYSALILNPNGASYMSGSDFDVDDAATHPKLFSFSPLQALTRVAATDPMMLVGWPPAWEALPGKHVAWPVLGLGLVAMLMVTGQGRRAAEANRRLALMSGAAMLGWLAAKSAALFFANGITQPSPDAMLLYAYLFYLLGRVELWLLFWTALASIVCIRLAPETRTQRDCAVLTLGVAATVLLMWWLPFAGTHLDARRNTLVPRAVAAAGPISPDDIQLATWIETNLRADKGTVGLASMPSMFGSTKLLFPISASQALPLYGQKYNFTFQLFDPSREYGYDEYMEHVSSYFDAEWCLRHNIGYFHLPVGNLHPNHGLARAREIGLLVPIRTVRTSALYEVRPLPWTPRAILLSTMPSSTHQITWKADGTAVAEGSDAQLVYTLDQPQFVHAIRFKYTITHAESQPAEAQLFWSSAGHKGFVEHERTAHVRLQPSNRETTFTILVHDTVNQFRFDPDIRPFTLRIRDVELLIKPQLQP